MPIKLNGSTSGSVELNVPAAVGSDLQVTIPATAGEVIVKEADGSVDLGAVDILSDGTIATGGLTSTPGTVAAGSFVQAAANAGFFGNNGDAKFGSSANNPVLFQVNGSEKARIDISGNIAIGTSSPNSFTNYKVLTIQGTTASGIDLEKADGTIQARFFGDATGVQIGAPAGSVRFETANTERLRILSDGNVGINESTPDSKLDIRYAAGTDSATQKLIHLRTDGSSSYASRGLFVKIGRDGSLR